MPWRWKSGGGEDGGIGAPTVLYTGLGCGGVLQILAQRIRVGIEGSVRGSDTLPYHDGASVKMGIVSNNIPTLSLFLSVDFSFVLRLFSPFPDCLGLGEFCWSL